MPSRFAGVEGLRAFACLSVVLAHSWFLNPLPPSQAAGPANKLVPYINFNLFSGLTLFFVLSGFLLYFPFARAVMEQRSLPSVPRFLRNRALRIMPAYWVVLLVTLLAGAAVTNSGYIAAVNHHDFSDV